MLHANFLFYAAVMVIAIRCVVPATSHRGRRPPTHGQFQHAQSVSFTRLFCSHNHKKPTTFPYNSQRTRSGIAERVAVEAFRAQATPFVYFSLARGNESSFTVVETILQVARFRVTSKGPACRVPRGHYLVPRSVLQIGGVYKSIQAQ